MVSYMTCLLVIVACCAHSALGISIICEGSSMYLSCPPGQVLYVHSGVYGRTQGAVICPHQSIKTTNCVSPSSTATVANLCNGKNLCSLSATNGVFGDPCYGTYKYLEVEYACF
ncbi:L-rhamnose-binding lectin CSL3-like [Dreissena polymorpha]|uniref:L-rhamnose-binding lectin CSL3-like n=1 Tax=Dreissena polymorpha TaxID=45954 RepID=UPI0022642252|nr:L-rhamnose-binding lectin CSL3-like [Dreissena polymorpha]